MKATIILVLWLFYSVGFAQDATALTNEGIKFHDNGEYDKAIEKYLEAIELEPNNGAAYYEAAFSYHLKKDLDNGLKMADKAIELATGDTKLMAFIVKGSIVDDKGDPKEALKVYERALKDYPDQYLLNFNYGITLARLRRYQESEGAYIKALTNRFSHPGSHLRFGDLKNSLNQKAPASLCYYFFLLLENKTPRSNEASQKLLTLIYGEPSDTLKEKTIYINSAALSGPLSAAETYISLLGSVSNDLSKLNGTVKSKQTRFIEDTGKYFSVLSDVSAPSKKKKKKNQDQGVDFFMQTYVPFFSDLHRAGHTEAFCYHIMAGADDADIQSWIEGNAGKMKAFYLWLETR